MNQPLIQWLISSFITNWEGWAFYKLLRPRLISIIYKADTKTRALKKLQNRDSDQIDLIFKAETLQFIITSSHHSSIATTSTTIQTPSSSAVIATQFFFFSRPFCHVLQHSKFESGKNFQFFNSDQNPEENTRPFSDLKIAPEFFRDQY